MAESWLNALNADIPPHSEKEKQEQRYNSAVRRPSVKERLVKAGIQVRKKVTIRAAPLKSSGLPPNYLNSKIAAMGKWVLNVQVRESVLKSYDFTSKLIMVWIPCTIYFEAQKLTW